MDVDRRETAVKHNQSFELLSNLGLLPPHFHHLIAHLRRKFYSSSFMEMEQSVGALAWFFTVKVPVGAGRQCLHLNIWLHSCSVAFVAACTSNYSCAASQNTKINKQSQRFWGPFVWLNKCLNPLLWLHFALTSSSCASFADQLKAGVPLRPWRVPSTCSWTTEHTLTHTHTCINTLFYHIS